jgi:ubiquinone/menaquinone biosynthesis C-methylase UbiE
MPSSYLNCFSDGNVPFGNSGNLRPDTYDYSLTAKRLIKLLKLSRGDEILDVGCGNGLLDDQLIHSVKKITFVEANPSVSKFLEEKYKDTKIFCLRSDDLSTFKDNSYDKVICIAVLQYCNDEEALETIKEAVRVCKKNGLIYFGDVFDSAVVHDSRDGMASFDPAFLGKGYNYKTILSNYEPEKRYDLIIQK